MNTQIILKLMSRDFRAYRTRIVGFSFITLVMGMFMIFINTNLSRMFTSSVSSFIIIAVIVPFLPELKNKSIWIQTASLPVTRRDMVVARFLISLCIVTINLLIYIIDYHLFLKILHADPTYALNVNMIIFAWANLLLALALFYFAYFRFSFIFAVGFYLFSMTFPLVFQSILNRFGLLLEDFDQSFSFSIIALILFLFSFFHSIVYFRKKNL